MTFASVSASCVESALLLLCCCFAAALLLLGRSFETTVGECTKQFRDNVLQCAVADHGSTLLISTALELLLNLWQIMGVLLAVATHWGDYFGVGVTHRMGGVPWGLG